MNNNVDLFTQQLQIVNRRINQIYEQASTKPLSSAENLLPLAFKELGLVTEELNVATEELIQQNDELMSTRYALEVQCQRYQDLFEFAPEPYLITDSKGVILEANRAAASLLRASSFFLIGKPLLVFVAIEEKSNFRTYINQIRHQDKPQELNITLYPNKGEPIQASLKTVPVRDPQGNISNLRISINDISDREQLFNLLDEVNADITRYTIKHSYTKGENIVLDHNYIYWVTQGLVKLSTISPQGDEVVLGFAGSEIPFGAPLTSLQIYQAIAFSKKVEVVALAIKDIPVFPHLAQSLVHKISRRLQQTESLLAIAGNRRIQDRLYYLLLLLKDEIGQPVPEGSCLSVRLTHQDLASICGTTRVTITRLVNKFQKEGLIAFDRYSHIIILEKFFLN